MTAQQSFYGRSSATIRRTHVKCPMQHRNARTLVCSLPSSSSSSSSCSLRVRRSSCSLILKVELVHPSLLRPSHVPSSFRSLSQCLSWNPICVHPLYVLYPLFLVLFYFLYYVLSSRFFPNAVILFFIQFCYS